jgi:hypothetical protein
MATNDSDKDTEVLAKLKNTHKLSDVNEADYDAVLPRRSMGRPL